MTLIPHTREILSGPTLRGLVIQRTPAFRADDTSEILTSHVRSIDTLARRVIFAERATDHVLDDARAKLAALLGIVI